MNLDPVLLSQISVRTGVEEGGLIPADFSFICAMPDEADFDDLIEWINCFFEKHQHRLQ